jgi:hypothetical protein
MNIAARIGDGSVAHIGGIDALRQEGEGVEEILILRVVKQGEPRTIAMLRSRTYDVFLIGKNIVQQHSGTAGLRDSAGGVRR